jgi:putative oxidoreductase
VSFLLATLTLVESLSILFFAAGVYFAGQIREVLSVLPGCCWPFFTRFCLLLGQRLAKDYAGAASLTGYFLVAMLGIIGAAFSGILFSCALLVS